MLDLQFTVSLLYGGRDEGPQKMICTSSEEWPLTVSCTQVTAMNAREKDLVHIGLELGGPFLRG
jgi:hypothetical protein